MPSAATTAHTPLTAVGPSRLAEYGDRDSNEVALTFTVGTRLDPAVEILELLTERGVAATIFMSGIVFDQKDTRASAERAAGPLTTGAAWIRRHGADWTLP